MSGTSGTNTELELKLQAAISKLPVELQGQAPAIIKLIVTGAGAELSAAVQAWLGGDWRPAYRILMASLTWQERCDMIESIGADIAVNNTANAVEAAQQKKLADTLIQILIGLALAAVGI